MSRTSKKIDPNQNTFDFTWRRQVDRYTESLENVHEAMAVNQPNSAGNDFEACIEIAAACQKAIRESGLSREQVVDKINEYFGRTDEGADTDPPECLKPLSLHMFNHYLSKPTEYRIPAYMLIALHRVTRSLEPARVIVAHEGADVANAQQRREMALGKLEMTMKEMRQLKNELRR